MWSPKQEVRDLDLEVIKTGTIMVAVFIGLLVLGYCLDLLFSGRPREPVKPVRNDPTRAHCLTGDGIRAPVKFVPCTTIELYGET